MLTRKWLGWIALVGILLGLDVVWGTQDAIVSSQERSRTDSVRVTQTRNPMRDMMRQMMQGLVPPPGMNAERLPNTGSQGAQLVAQYCGQCHDLPSPVFHTAEEWPSVFERMLTRMEMMGGGMMGGGMMGMGRVEAPSTKEADTLLTYLQDQGMRRVSPDELAMGALADRRIFQTECAQCHALPSPSMHRAEDWLAVVARMQGNMTLMNRRVIDNEAREAIVRFLQEAAPGHTPSTGSIVE